MVDTVIEVLTIPSSQIEKTPANLGSAWKDIATGIHKLIDELLVLVDVQALLKL
jgi:purine-binding chemotaxis protein CheW